ncbi:low affinity immunoglobulin gamma Fc region receptor III-A-like isoform X2 [Thunnus thynnus]|uniref:low affinity immunoglobulin gamma Fc region receptor III-A-like isoform X2 n=1 Tax=Thunnus thynnus TaxID=8237 RepID=UPI003529545E
MEVTALCFRLLINVLILLVANVQQSHPQTSDADVRIVPSRLQLFDHESVSFTCEGFVGSAGWRVKNINELIPECSNMTCNIEYVLPSDSGEYWCEGGGQRSNTVNITVTGGSVILESPVLPVMEGEAVTLYCRNKTISNLKADFYKDGDFIKTDSTGNMTIHNVSKRDEGLYKCSISGVGESPESGLAVRVEIPKYNGSVTQSKDSLIQLADKTASWKEINFPHHYVILLWTVVTVLLVLQLLVIGLLQWKKQLDTADAADNLNLCLDTNHSSKPQTEKDETRPQSFDSTFTTDDTPQALQNEWRVSSITATADPSAATDPPLPDQDNVYSTI